MPRDANSCDQPSKAYNNPSLPADPPSPGPARQDPDSVAQSVEQQTFNLWVLGSIPSAVNMRIASLLLFAVLITPGVSPARPVQPSPPVSPSAPRSPSPAAASQPAATRPSSPANAIAPATPFVDPVTGFSIAPPKFSETAQKAPIVAFYAPPQNGSTATVNVHVDPVRSTRRDYVEASLRALRRAESKINVNRELQVAGHDAQLFDYEGTLGARRLHFLQLLVITDDIVYIVTCTAPADTFDQYREAFQKCLDSFRPPAK